MFILNDQKYTKTIQIIISLLFCNIFAYNYSKIINWKLWYSFDSMIIKIILNKNIIIMCTRGRSDATLYNYLVIVISLHYTFLYENITYDQHISYTRQFTHYTYSGSWNPAGSTFLLVNV